MTTYMLKKCQFWKKNFDWTEIFFSLCSGHVPAAKGSGGIVGGATPPTTSTGGQESTTTTTASVETKVSLSGLSGAEVKQRNMSSHIIDAPHTHTQRLARRAARFGENTSIDAKKMARAER